MRDEPPRAPPENKRSGRPSSCCISDGRLRVREPSEAKSDEKRGTRAAHESARGPRSISRTEHVGSALKRFASTQPAVPPPVA